MQTIRVYKVLNKSGMVLSACEEWDELSCSLEVFKSNRREKYGEDIKFAFNYCYSL